MQLGEYHDVPAVRVKGREVTLEQVWTPSAGLARWYAPGAAAGSRRGCPQRASGGWPTHTSPTRLPPGWPR